MHTAKLRLDYPQQGITLEMGDLPMAQAWLQGDWVDTASFPRATEVRRRRRPSRFGAKVGLRYGQWLPAPGEAP